MAGCRLCGSTENIAQNPQAKNLDIWWCFYTDIVNCLERADLRDLAEEMRKRGFR